MSPGGTPQKCGNAIFKRSCYYGESFWASAKMGWDLIGVIFVLFIERNFFSHLEVQIS